MRSTKEDGRPGFYWFPKDWMADTGLRVSSLASKGLWIEMLNLMFFAPTRGTLRNSQNTNITIDVLTNLLYKTDTKIIQNLLDELEQNKVFDRLEDGTIINRKMYREAELSRVRKEAVSKRWHTKVIQKNNTKPIQRIGIGKGLVGKEAVDWFNDLWQSYPKRLGRKMAYKHFMSSVKSEVDLENIKKALENYKTSVAGKDPQYIQHGSTWFNNWRDWTEQHQTTGDEDGDEILS